MLGHRLTWHLRFSQGKMGQDKPIMNFFKSFNFRNMTEGHGRAADIWSVSCVVLEMIKVEINKLSEFNLN